MSQITEEKIRQDFEGGTEGDDDLRRTLAAMMVHLHRQGVLAAYRGKDDNIVYRFTATPASIRAILSSYCGQS
jgi:hypothetical protein